VEIDVIVADAEARDDLGVFGNNDSDVLSACTV